MKLRYLLFLLVLLAIFPACNRDKRPTPTPFSNEDMSEEALDSASSQSMSITDLAANPEAFANSFVKISGRYRRLPLLVCDSDPHPSPATWQLVAEDGSAIAVGGFDSQIRPLLPDNLTMTVAGVWQLFDGPVGCGKNASGTQIWYLKASDILSPSPIARVTLTPTGAGGQIADSGEGTAVSPTTDPANPNATPTLPGNDDGGGDLPATPTGDGATIPTPPNNSTPTSDPNDPEGSGPTNTPTPTSDAANNDTPTPTGDGSATATPTGGTPAPTTSGGGGGSGNPTPTNSALSTATRNPNDFDVVEFDDLSPETPVLELLAANEAHLWPILFENTGAITITAVAEANMDLVLEILNPANDVVQQANSGGVGALESIINAQLNLALDYKIRVYDLNSTEGEYCLIFSEAEGFPDSIKGRLTYGQTVNQTIEVLAINYWCFMGEKDDSITISSAVTGNTGDFVVALFGPPDFDAIGDEVFTTATLTNLILPEDGMYMIGILDLDAGAASYSLTLNKK